MTPDFSRTDSSHIDSSRTDFSHYAQIAARSVVHHFGTRALGLPGTLLGKVVVPDERTRRKKFARWHYWWQAHFLDNAVDAGFRHLCEGNKDEAQVWLERAQAIQRGITVRNFGGVTNDYYDDMAWLTLALERLNALHTALHGTGDVKAQDAASTLYRALTSACTDDLGGGAFWSTARDFKNTPATAPIALAFARAHRFDEANSLLGWLRSQLWDDNEQVYRDGIKITSRKRGKVETKLEGAAYSYNAGPVLGAVLGVIGGATTIDERSQAGAYAREHARDIVAGVQKNFTVEFDLDGSPLTVLDARGDGDGGLFTGILARYLALAANSPELDEATRKDAREIVLNTARVLWAGRREFDPTLQVNQAGVNVNEIVGDAVALFSPTITEHASDALRPGASAELSSQLQAWMIFEAAATLA